MRASGLLLGGGNIAQENKYTICNTKQNDGRVRKAPSACQKARAEVGQGDFPFDDCQQTWRSPFIRGRQRHTYKKSTPRRKTDLITPETTRRHDGSTLSHLCCFPSVKDLELSARSRRLWTNSHCTTWKRRQRAGHEVGQRQVFQLLKKPERTVSSRRVKLHDTQPLSTGHVFLFVCFSFSTLSVISSVRIY